MTTTNGKDPLYLSAERILSIRVSAHPRAVAIESFDRRIFHPRRIYARLRLLLHFQADGRLQTGRAYLRQPHFHIATGDNVFKAACILIRWYFYRGLISHVHAYISTFTRISAGRRSNGISMFRRCSCS